MIDLFLPFIRECSLLVTVRFVRTIQYLLIRVQNENNDDSFAPTATLAVVLAYVLLKYCGVGVRTSTETPIILTFKQWEPLTVHLQPPLYAKQMMAEVHPTKRTKKYQQQILRASHLPLCQRLPVLKRLRRSYIARSVGCFDLSLFL